MSLFGRRLADLICSVGYIGLVLCSWDSDVRGEAAIKCDEQTFEVLEMKERNILLFLDGW